MPAPAMLGPYRLESKLGAGGMGEVFRAVDTRLKRTVAVKILTPGGSENRELRLRFQVEARAISNLSHPHICTLHDVGQQDGADFLVMEYLEGETLRDRLTKGPLPLEEALRYAAQILSALYHAHRKGIIHRDLKPANVMLTGAGANRSAKLLDFGLAAVRTAPAGDDQSTELELTGPDQIVGTPQYFAPEVLHGKPADARSDLHAFGAVLYEMLTGRAAFEGPSRAQVLASVMRDTPPPLALGGPGLSEVIARCLAKDPEERWQTASDLAAALRIASGAAPPLVATPPRSRLLTWLVGGALVCAGLALAAFLRKPVEGVADPLRLQLMTPVRGEYLDFALSPDGQTVAYTSGLDLKSELWIAPLSAASPRLVEGSDGAEQPFWSPDGKSVAFFARG